MKLPLEYNTLSKFFDAVGSGSTSDTNHVVEKILKKYKVKTVLDLTCGTGSQVFWLSKRGYKIIGSDFSPELIKIAKRKAKEKNLKTKFLIGDMRTQQLGKFDAVITIFNAIGHLTKAGFTKALKNIHKNLNKNGIYVFDIFNVASLNDKDLSDLDMDITKTVDGVKIHIFQYSRLDKRKGKLISYDHYFFPQKSGEAKKLKVEFALQIYTAKELQRLLTKNGFKVLSLCGRDGKKFSEKRTKEMLMVAQRM
jgi:SAM-dependent methyltransferase